MEHVYPLPELNRYGWLLVQDGQAIAIDPPLDVDDVQARRPGGVPISAVVETGVPAYRIGGGRLLAEALDVPMFAPAGAIRGSEPLRDGDVIPAFRHVGVEAWKLGVNLVTDSGWFVGDLLGAVWTEDAAPYVTAKEHVAAAAGMAVIHAGAGDFDAASMVDVPLPVTGPPPLNRDAVALTNRGEADLYWADPRFVEPSTPVALSYVKERLDSPWAPTVLDLRSESAADLPTARRIAPPRLASELLGLTGERELAVIADAPELAAQAAGFLVRLGLRASWVETSA